MRFCIALAILFALSACTSKGNGDRSTLTMSIPSLSELNAKASNAQKVSSLSIDPTDVRWENACFMVGVTAPDIPSRASSSCELPSGVFYGSVPAAITNSSAQISLEVPKGEGRRVVVYAYFRHAASEACVIHDNLNRYSRERVAILGSTENVSLKKDRETVSVDISLPSQMIASQLALPAACSQQSATGQRFASSSLAPVLTTNFYRVRTSAGGAAKTVIDTSGGYRVYRKRGMSP